MRLEHGDDHDIRHLVQRGSAEWSGPNPVASQSRWTAAATRRRPGRAALAAGLGFAVIGLGVIAVLAVARPANDAAGSVSRLVSHVLPVPPPAAPTARPSSPSPSGSPPRPVPPTALAVPPRSTPRRVPSPGPSDDDYRRPSPSPSPSPSNPSPSPSRSPDE